MNMNTNTPEENRDLLEKITGQSLPTGAELAQKIKTMEEKGEETMEEKVEEKVEAELYYPYCPGCGHKYFAMAKVPVSLARSNVLCRDCVAERAGIEQ